MTQGVMYYNPRLQHQVDHAEAFKACGFEITTAVRKPDPDVVVISGNWFAYQHCKNHPRCLMIDRAMWGDGDDDPKVSIGWLQPDGTRKFATGDAPRPKPIMMDWKPAWPSMGVLSALVLADYGQDVDDIVTQARERFVQVEVRRHPADKAKGTFDNIPLPLQVGWYDAVIGTSGTAIFEAITRGIPTICLDSSNPCAPVCSDTIDGELYRGSRDEWLHDMSYTQFSLAEIADGTAWALLKDIQ